MTRASPARAFGLILTLAAVLTACAVESPSSFLESAGASPTSGTASAPESFTPTGSPSSAPSESPGWLTLADLLDRLSTDAEQRTGYERSLFVHWIDADADGCDTRREVLADESLTAVTIGSGCDLAGGSWLSIYDGRGFSDPTGMDIDHVVPLAEAWDSGAFGWSPERRKQFANDLAVSWSLIAVSASSNRSKGDQDPGEWLPPAAEDLCSYLGDWLAVKVRWSLSVDATERGVIDGLIGSCTGTTRPVVLAP